MTLREKIQESIINAGNNFYYDSEYSLNRILDNATFPTVHLCTYCKIQESTELEHKMLDKCNVRLYFLIYKILTIQQLRQMT